MPGSEENRDPTPTLTTRAVVLARGLGTRMRKADAADASLGPAQAAAADAGLKAMIPFGRPFLDHSLHRLADAGFTDVALVLGPEHDQVRDYYRRLATRRLTISFVTQPEPVGTADAVVCAQAWTGGDPFITLNADNLYPVDVLARLARGRTPAAPGFDAASLALPLEKIGTYAQMEPDAAGCLARIREKPGAEAIAAAGAAAMISLNVWRFDARIFDACRDVPVSSRGERELPQAVGLAASRGMCIELFRAKGPVIDLSRRSDVAGVGRVLDGARVDL